VKNRINTVVESRGRVAISVVPLSPLEKDLSVQYRTIADTALAGEDYIETSGTLFWTAGDNTEQVISVEILSDQIIEHSESLMLQLDVVPTASVLNPASQINSVIVINDEAPLNSVQQCPTSTYSNKTGDNNGGSFSDKFLLILLLLVFCISVTVKCHQARNST